MLVLIVTCFVSLIILPVRTKSSQTKKDEQKPSNKPSGLDQAMKPEEPVEEPVDAQPPTPKLNTPTRSRTIFDFF